MHEENAKPGYYSIIPSNVRYDERLRCSEKLMYGEITALSNVNGYCTAGNSYFANLYKVDKRSVTRWLGNLQKYNYIKIILHRNEKKVVLRRDIYMSTPIDNFVSTPIDKNNTRVVTQMSSNSITRTTTTEYINKALEYGIIDMEEFKLEFELFKNYNSNTTDKINLYYWERWCSQHQREQYKQMKQSDLKINQDEIPA